MALTAMATACIVVIALEARLYFQPRQSLLTETGLQGGVAIMASSEVPSSFDVDGESTIVGLDRTFEVAAAHNSAVKVEVMPVGAAEGTIDSLGRRSSVLTTMV